MKKIAFLLAGALVAGASMTSCLHDPKNSQEVTLNYGGSQAFNRVTDLESGEVTISVNPNYKMTYSVDGNEANGRVSVDMTGIQLGIPGLAFRLNDLAFKYDNMTAYYGTTAENVTPIGGGGYVFDKFRMYNIIGRAVDGQSCPVYTISFTVNNRYQVTVLPAEVILVGRTHSVQEGDGTAFDTTKPYLTIQVNPQKMEADVQIGRAQLRQTMPETGLLLTGLAVSTNANGYTIAFPEGTEQMPLKYSNNQAMEDSYVRDFALSFDVNSGATTLTGKYTVKLGDKTETFDVSLDMGYLYKLEDLQN